MDRFTPDACILRCASFNPQPCESLNVVPSLNVTTLLHLEAPLFYFILSCDTTLLLYQDIACISSQNVLKNVACLAEHPQRFYCIRLLYVVLLFLLGLQFFLY